MLLLLLAQRLHVNILMCLRERICSLDIRQVLYLSLISYDLFVHSINISSYVAIGGGLDAAIQDLLKLKNQLSEYERIIRRLDNRSGELLREVLNIQLEK